PGRHGTAKPLVTAVAGDVEVHRDGAVGHDHRPAHRHGGGNPSVVLALRPSPFRGDSRTPPSRPVASYKTKSPATRSCSPLRRMTKSARPSPLVSPSMKVLGPAWT